MLLQKQKFLHDPENGVYGDCHRACYASILGVPLDEIPHFFDKDRSWDEAQPLFKEVHKKFNVMPMRFVFDGDAPMGDILETAHYQNPGVPFIFGGISRSEVGHSVIGCGMRIVWDPSRNDVGIKGPMGDGYWYVTYLVGKIPSRTIESSVFRRVEDV